MNRNLKYYAVGALIASVRALFSRSPRCWGCKQRFNYKMCDHLSTDEPHCNRCCLQIQDLSRPPQMQAATSLGSYPAWYPGRGVAEYRR